MVSNCSNLLLHVFFCSRTVTFAVVSKSSQVATPHSGVCVCVEHLFAKVLLSLIVAGGAGGTDETGTNKDAHQLPVKQWGTLHCVPAACDKLCTVAASIFISFGRWQEAKP